MEFQSREDIAAPIETVFAAVTDFPAFERQVLRRGAEVRRLDSLPRPGAGLKWAATFQFRGRDRNIQIEITEYDPPHALRLGGESQGLGFAVAVDLMALSRNHTRMNVAAVIEPLSFTAKLLVQSLKLARGNLNRRFETRVTEFAREIELRHTRGAKAPR